MIKVLTGIKTDFYVHEEGTSLAFALKGKDLIAVSEKK